MSLVVGDLMLGVLSLATARQAQEPAKRGVDPSTAAAALIGEVRETIGEARFGGLWLGDTDGRVKIGVVKVTTAKSGKKSVGSPLLPTVDSHAQSTVMALAEKHGAQAVVDVVPVYHTMAAIEACNEWVQTQAETVNKGAPLPMGSGIGRVGPGRGVVLRLPDKATSAQKNLAKTAQERCGYTMLQIKPGQQHPRASR